MQSFFMRTTKTLTRLRGNAGWFESSLDAHIRRYVFPGCGNIILQIHPVSKLQLLSTLYSTICVDSVSGEWKLFNTSGALKVLCGARKTSPSYYALVHFILYAPLRWLSSFDRLSLNQWLEGATKNKVNRFESAIFHLYEYFCLLPRISSSRISDQIVSVSAQTDLGTTLFAQTCPSQYFGHIQYYRRQK